MSYDKIKEKLEKILCPSCDTYDYEGARCLVGVNCPTIPKILALVHEIAEAVEEKK